MMDAPETIGFGKLEINSDQDEEPQKQNTEPKFQNYNSDDSTDFEEDETTIYIKSHKEQILWSCEKGKLDLLSKLLKDDPSLVNVQDEDKYTPLHRASYSNQPDVLKVLLKSGANINAKTVDGWTPLHSACKWNNFICASILIDSGAEINEVTNSGQTPLHLAASNPTAEETSQLLLMDYRIDLSIKNSVGETAAQIASRCGPFSSMYSIGDPILNFLKTEDTYDLE